MRGLAPRVTLRCDRFIVFFCLQLLGLTITPGDNDITGTNEHTGTLTLKHSVPLIGTGID